MNKQVLLVIITIIILMKLFTNENKLKNYSTFQSVGYKPLEIENFEEDSDSPSEKTLNLFPNIQTITDYKKPVKARIEPTQKKVEEKTTPNVHVNSLGKFVTGYDWIPDNQEVDVPYQETDDTGDVRPTRGLAQNLPIDRLMKLSMKGLAGAESTNNYKLLLENTGIGGKKGSGAWGKYQFIGKHHGDKIKKVTGLNLQQFLKSEKAQDTYFKWHFEHELLPKFKKVRAMGLGKGLSDVQIIGGLHYRNNEFIPMLQRGELNKKATDNPINPTLLGHMNKVEKWANRS